MGGKITIYPRYARVTGHSRHGHITRRLDGECAKMPPVRAELKAHTLAVAGKAKALLASVRFEGDASVRVAKGRQNYYVQLVDGKGQHGAAMSIEFGREGYSNPKRWHRVVAKNGQSFLVGQHHTKPTWVLHRAGGLSKG